jgi:hypothetical protein
VSATDAVPACDRAIHPRRRRTLTAGGGLGLSIVAALVRGAAGELKLCHDGQHSSHGRQMVDVPCRHSPAMIAAVILPA